MRPIPSDDILEILGCDIGSRPAGAPGANDLGPFVQSIEHDGTSLKITFDRAARPALLAFAEAERQCCGGIGWTIIEAPELILRIEAPRPALDVITNYFTNQGIESHQ